MYNIGGSDEVSKLISKDALRKPIIDLSPGKVRTDIPLDEIVKICDKIVKSPIPETPYRRFSEFRKIRDRYHYEFPLCEKRKNMYFLSIGVLLTKNNSFLETLNDYLWSICEESTWSLPAHLPDEIDFGEHYICHYTSTTAEQLGEIWDVLGDRLETNIKNRIAFELKKRVFMPFVQNPDHYSMVSNLASNVCGVCCGAIGAAAITFKLEEPYLSRLLTEAIHHLNRYLDHFDSEGGWVEGVNYWNFGLTHLVRFADALYKITEGKLNLFEHPKLAVTGSFAVHCFLPPDDSVNFNDSERNNKLSPDLIKSLAINTPAGAELSWLLGELPEHRLDRPIQKKYDGKQMETLRNLRKQTLPEPRIPDKLYRHFKGLGWLITRKSWQDRLAPVLAVKAGHNNELHGHTNVGHFIFRVFGHNFLWDLGAGRQDRSYLRKLYQNPSSPPKLNTKSIFQSTQAHSLIFIGGESEEFGKEFQGKITEFKPGEKKDTIVLDLTKAYPSELASKVTRKLFFLKDRPDGGLILQDEVKAKKKTSIESRLQIQGEVQVIGKKQIILRSRWGKVWIGVEEPENAYIKIGELKNLGELKDLVAASTLFKIKVARYMSIIIDNVNSARFIVKILPFRDKNEINGQL